MPVGSKGNFEGYKKVSIIRRSGRRVRVALNGRVYMHLYTYSYTLSIVYFYFCVLWKTMVATTTEQVPICASYT